MKTPYQAHQPANFVLILKNQMKKHFTLKNLLLPILLIISSTLSAQFVNIPDANFKAALLANSSINTTPDGEIDSTEANAYTGGIVVGTMGISDLTGIQAFTNITGLDFSQNSVTSVDLSENYFLQTLICNLNGLTCLDLGQNFNLVYLDCSDNNLQKLNIKNFNNTSVIYFNAVGNSSLGCIQVDNVSFSIANWTNVPAGSTFNTDCGAPVASFTSDSPACLGNPINFSNTSTNAVSYEWNFGDGNSSTDSDPSHTYLIPSGYTVILTAHSDCYGQSNYSWNQYVYASDIFGRVTYSGGPVTSGNVVLLKNEPVFTTFDTIAITALNAVGEYNFSIPPSYDYLIKVYPDTTLYPNLVPTYKGDVWSWDSAAILSHGCTQTDTADIYMYELPILGGGPGSLAGTIVEGQGFGRAQGDPIHGVDVKLGITGSNVIVANTETDLNGDYSFNNLPYGDYTIFVDIPGLNRDSSYQMVIDSVNSSYENLDYIVDSNSVYIVETIGIDENHSSIGHLGLYPNPAHGQTTIIYTLTTNSTMVIEVYDMLGIKHQTLFNGDLLTGEHTYTFNTQTMGLKPGLYFIRLTTGSKTSTVQMLVIE